MSSSDPQKQVHVHAKKETIPARRAQAPPQPPAPRRSTRSTPQAQPQPQPKPKVKPFDGLKIFYDPEKRNLVANLDLVFVHGLNGDHIKTWADEDTGVVWPRDLIPQTMPNARVLSFGYNADIYDNPSVAFIRGYARTLLNLLVDMRSEIVGVRPIVLVAHSLGGLVVKQALRLARNETPFRGIAVATRGILLFSTPHHGADEDRWARIAEGFSPLAPGRSTSSHGTTKDQSADRSPLVEALKVFSRDVQDISEDFRFLAGSYALFSFYETDVWPGTRAPIVSKDSALLNLPHEDQVPLAANHVEMVRFDGLEDSKFMQVEKRIQRAAKGLPSVASTRLDMKQRGLVSAK
ncbi:uncharacterized protein PAC_12700 [Phialocephala subalpina]|uniref:AB hydrolase-1 domain-containing protein n=1 Tax=Phialocephala subalpina TaxID=576137 RepID=A0A1L7XCR1_9HELO|nr:uncharacterized protein PAC_12700 [Phialocephala subalpina]